MKFPRLPNTAHVKEGLPRSVMGQCRSRLVRRPMFLACLLCVPLFVYLAPNQAVGAGDEVGDEPAMGAQRDARPSKEDEPATAAAEPAVSTRPPASTVGAGRTPSQVGSLHRVAGTLEAALDVYRLALLEMVPATRLMIEAGRAKGATPSTPIPPASVSVFRAMERGVRRRVPEQSLPAIGRGYHAEVMEHLEVLAAAETLGDVRVPLGRTLWAMLEVGKRADEVVDLFSRHRPIRARVVDRGEVLDELAEALEELAASEAQVGFLRNAAEGHAVVAGAYRRMEISLSHVLNLWALARDAGIDFEDTSGEVFAGLEIPAQISTASLEVVLAGMRRHADMLQESIEILSATPAPMRAPPVAQIYETKGEPKNGEGASRGVLTWASLKDASPAGRAAVIRIYRRDNVAAISEKLVRYLVCDGVEREAAVSQAATSVAELSDQDAFVADVPPGRVSMTEHFESEPLAPPLYRVTTVSAFGVEAKAGSVTALMPSRKRLGAMGIEAERTLTDPSDPKFYYDYDKVHVTWTLSGNDLRLSPDRLQESVNRALPVTARYVIHRVVGGEPSKVGEVPAGVARFVDRPSVSELAAGIRYAVVAHTQGGKAVRTPNACATSEAVQVDLAPALQWARAGLANVVHPTALETSAREALRVGGTQAVATAWAAFLERSDSEQKRLQSRWWDSVSKPRRLAWAQRWGELHSPEERDRVRASWDGALSARDLPWAQASLYLLAAPELYGEVERWWTLLDDATRSASISRWIATLNGAHRQQVQRQRAPGVVAVGDPIAVAKVLEWWNSRDAIEHQGEIARWWGGNAPAQKTQALRTWLAARTAIEQESIVWPQWHALTESEKLARSRDAHLALPEALRARFLAWLAWGDLGVDDRLGAVQHELGSMGTVMSQARWALRGIDAAVAFKLPVLLVLLVTALLMAWFLFRSVVRQREMYIRRIPGIDAIEEAIGRATEMGRPVLYIPGIDEIQELQTIAGLLILGKVSETIAKYDADIIVANIYPFVQTVAREVVQRGCYDAGRPDRYNPEDVRFIAAEQFPFTAGVNGIMLRERPAANFFFGRFFAESLILSETGFLTGAVQVAGTAELAQLPFFIAACDYTLIGEELFAASAYLSREPKVISTLKAGDWVKLGLVGIMLLGVVLESTGVTALSHFLMSH